MWCVFNVLLSLSLSFSLSLFFSLSLSFSFSFTYFLPVSFCSFSIQRLQISHYHLLISTFFFFAISFFSCLLLLSHWWKLFSLFFFSRPLSAASEYHLTFLFSDSSSMFVARFCEMGSDESFLFSLLIVVPRIDLKYKWGSRWRRFSIHVSFTPVPVLLAPCLCQKPALIPVPE